MYVITQPYWAMLVNGAQEDAFDARSREIAKQISNRLDIETIVLLRSLTQCGCPSACQLPEL